MPRSNIPAATSGNVRRPVKFDAFLRQNTGTGLPHQETLFGNVADDPAPAPPNWTAISTPDIDRLIDQGAAVAIGCSGGKDSMVASRATVEYLDKRGHRGPRILIHADLGEIEWAESLPTCQKLADQLGCELVVVRRAAGGLLERFESRWGSSIRRYQDLSTVTLVLPWSTSSMPFCRSETKVKPIEAELRRRFKDLPIINVTGIRRQESRARSKATIADVNKQLTRRGLEGWNWRPIPDWTVDDVFGFIADRGLPLHIGYTEWGMTRISCVTCILSSLPDLKSALKRESHWPIFRRIVSLEIASTFGFQGSRWLGDVAPQLMSDEMAVEFSAAKERAQARKLVEAEIPQELLYVKGWPVRQLTQTEAELLASCRRRVADIMGFKEMTCLDAESVLARYDALLTLKAAKGAAADIEETSAVS